MAKIFRILSAACFAVILTAAAPVFAQPNAMGGAEFKIGDRVEVDLTGSKRFYERGVIVEFRRNDMYNGRTKESGYFWRVRLDSMDPDEEGRIYKAADMRLLNPPTPDNAGGAAPMPMPGGTEPMPAPGPAPAPMPVPAPPANGAPMAGAAEFKIGDRVECDVTGSKRYYERGTIVEFRNSDYYNGRSKDSGYFWRIRYDSMDPDEEGRVCKAADMRPIGPPMQVQNVAAVAGFFDRQLTGTVMPDRPIEKCPVEQKQVARNAKPDTEVIARVIRCLWEAPAQPGLDGAITIDVTPLKVGQSRRWNLMNDLGNGDVRTTVFPIQTDFTTKTWYRRQTLVRVARGTFNCFVNTFSEWECGLSESKRLSEETIRKPLAPLGAAF